MIPLSVRLQTLAGIAAAGARREARHYGDRFTSLTLTVGAQEDAATLYEAARLAYRVEQYGEKVAASWHALLTLGKYGDVS